MKILFRWCGAVLVTVVGLLNASCGKAVDKPAWSQIQADVANSGQSFAGAIAKKASVSVQLDSIYGSSPVLASDGSVYVGTAIGGDKTTEGNLVHLDGNTLAILQRVTLKGLLSTPAIDQAGNVYIAQMTLDGTGAHLRAFTPDLSREIFDVAMPTAKSVSAPKVLDLVQGSLIFEAYSGAFGSLVIANEKGQNLMNQDMCVAVQGGYTPGFHLTGIDIPYVEDASVAIRRGNDGFYHMVMASNYCGVLFCKVLVGVSSAQPPKVITLASADTNGNNDKYYASPAISGDGTALINDSDGYFTAYDFVTGKQKWQHQMSGPLYYSPVVMPLNGPKAFCASNDHLTKVDIATGIVEGNIAIPAPPMTSPAVGGSYIYITSNAGLGTYGLDLATMASTPLTGCHTPLAIGPAGQIYIGSSDGHLYLFPGF